VQAAKAELASEEEKAKLAEPLLSVPEGPESRVVSGAVMSGGGRSSDAVLKDQLLSAVSGLPAESLTPLDTASPALERGGVGMHPSSLHRRLRRLRRYLESWRRTGVADLVGGPETLIVGSTLLAVLHPGQIPQSAGFEGAAWVRWGLFAVHSVKEPPSAPISKAKSRVENRHSTFA
jgi:hypothetical protein